MDMKKLLIIIGGIIVVIVLILLVAPLLIPMDSYKGELLAQIEKATGRKARIDGDFSFSLIPNVQFTAGKVSLANAPGAKPPEMVSLDKLNVRVALLPLLHGAVEIDSFVLQKPVIHLSIDAQGRPNWQFKTQTAAAKPIPTQPSAAAKAPPSKAPPSESGGGFGLSGLRLGDMRLVDGTITYSDARNGTDYTVNDINMTVSLPSLDSALNADGSLVWNKQKIALKLGVASPSALMDGKASNFAASVSSKPINLSFKGEASASPTIKAHGTLDLDVPSVRELAAWTGKPLSAPGNGFGPLKIAGTVTVDGSRYSFTQAKLALDKIAATGDFRYDGSRKKPYVSAKLDAGIVDLNPYMPPEAPAAKPGAPAPKPGEPAPPAGGKAAQGWSDAPLDLSALRTVDADMDVKVEQLLVRKIKVGKSEVKLAIKDGKLTTDLTQMALYNGNGKAKLTADGAARVPAVTAALELSGLQANPALSDAMGLDRIEGTLNANMQLAASGASQRAMVSALDGKGKVAFTNGAIRGINLAALVRNVQDVFLNPKAMESQKTDFAELSGTFTISNGMLHNDDLQLLSPLLRVTGKGTVNLPQQTVDYRIEPKVVASTKGQGGKTDLSGLMVPVIVSGPWNNLSYRPDLAGAIKQNPAKALEQLKKALPGGNKSSPSDGGSVPNPGDALKKLFGR
jgi:AsmA protein